MIPIEHRLAIQDLYAEYASAIDEFRLDDWLALFAESSSYQIVPRNNYDRGLPLALMLCESKDMLRDRVVALQQANEYDIHTDRHLISGLRIRGQAGTLIRVEADFAVFRCNSEGEASLNAVGRYLAGVWIEAGQARFADKTVVLDNFCVPHAISTPL